MVGEHHPFLESTQLTLKQRVEQDSSLPDLYYVLTDVQTAGRGRGNHEWISPLGNLYTSIFIRKLPFQELTWIPHWISVCVLKALIQSGVDQSKIQLKWPNDLWVEKSKKIAGILCEKKGDSIIAGIGLNLIHAPDTVKDSGIVPHTENVITPMMMLQNILEQMNTNTSVSLVREFYEAHALFKPGDRIEWFHGTDQEKQSGLYFELGKYGELVVDQNGKKIQLFTEDVRMVRGS